MNKLLKLFTVKCSLLTVYCLFFFVHFSYAQKYYPLVDTNKLWSIQHIGIGYPNDIYSSYYIKFTKDTTIKGIIYKKVIQSDDSLIKKWENNGFIRETSDEKVYYLQNINATVEICLYDFNVKKSDTIFPIPTYAGYIVDSINNILIGKQLRKLFYIKPILYGESEIWIEGIGSLCGILDVGMCALMGGENSLLCFTENDTLKYENPEYNYCYYQVGVSVNEVRSQKPEVRIYPNPMDWLSVVSYQLSVKSHVTIKIYNLIGNEVKIVLNKEEGKGKHDSKFDVSDLKNGIYLCSLNIGNEILTRKIVIIH